MRMEVKAPTWDAETRPACGSGFFFFCAAGFFFVGAAALAASLKNSG